MPCTDMPWAYGIAFLCICLSCFAIICFFPRSKCLLQAGSETPKKKTSKRKACSEAWSFFWSHWARSPLNHFPKMRLRTLSNQVLTTSICILSGRMWRTTRACCSLATLRRGEPTYPRGTAVEQCVLEGEFPRINESVLYSLDIPVMKVAIRYTSLPPCLHLHFVPFKIWYFLKILQSLVQSSFLHASSLPLHVQWRGYEGGGKFGCRASKEGTWHKGTNPVLHHKLQASMLILADG